MITIGVSSNYCCQDSEYRIYKINGNLNDDILNKLKYYTDSQDDIYDVDIFTGIPCDNIELSDRDTYDRCDFRLYCQCANNLLSSFAVYLI